MANPGESPIPPLTVRSNSNTSDWGCILMPTNHSRRWGNKTCMYEVALLWVWSGWQHLIKPNINNKIQYKGETCDCETKHTSDWGCILMPTTTSHSHSWVWKHFIHVWSGPTMSMKRVGGLNHKDTCPCQKQKLQNLPLLLTLTLSLPESQRADISLGLHPYGYQLQ